MDFKTTVENLLKDFLEQRKDLFLIELKISSNQEITVVLDGDHGVSLQDCLDASRAIENNLDRETQDFSLQVMSAGVSEGLILPRQYKKNIGRTLVLQLTDGTEYTADLVFADDSIIKTNKKYRKPKDIGKGKTDAIEEKEFNYNNIKKAIVEVKF